MAIDALLAVGCGSKTPPAASKPKPVLPQILNGEPLLPCPHGAAAGTTIGMEGCSEQRLLRTYVKIVAHERAIYSLLSAKACIAFASGERAWVVYQEGLCTARVSRYDGGTGGPLEFGFCEEEISSAHLKALAATQSLLTQH